MEANASFRWGGTLGILSILMFVLATFGGFVAPSGNRATVDLDPTLPTRLAVFFVHILAPLTAIAPFHAFYRWMRSAYFTFAPFVYTMGLVSLIVWICAGLLFFSAARHANETLFQVGYSLFDGAQMILTLYIIGTAYAMQRFGRIFTSRAGYVIGGTTLAILLLGPFEDTSLWVIYAYGAFPTWVFYLSVALLRHADQLATSNSL